MATTTVKLYSKELKKVVPHDIDHANRIFAYKHPHGWELHDENFTLNENGVIVRSSTKQNKATDKPGATSDSDAS